MVEYSPTTNWYPQDGTHPYRKTGLEKVLLAPSRPNPINRQGVLFKYIAIGLAHNLIQEHSGAFRFSCY